MSRPLDAHATRRSATFVTVIMGADPWRKTRGEQRQGCIVAASSEATMRLPNAFSSLCGAALLLFSVTLGLDLFQQRLVSPAKQTIVFASMWSDGEEMSIAYRKLFQEFEAENPRYRVEARWDGRWMLTAVRPRLLTHSDVPDVINTDNLSLDILVKEGYAEPLDAALDAPTHPDEPGQPLRAAYDSKVLSHCRWDDVPGRAPGTYLVPSNAHYKIVLYNRVHYERLGLHAPSTWPELLANCEKLKAAGLTPFAAAGAVYANFWSEALVSATVGDDTLRRTVEGTGPRFDQDARYRSVFEAIRALHRPGWFLEHWQEATFSGGERSFMAGEATHQINGTWMAGVLRRFEANPATFRVGYFAVPSLDGKREGAETKQPMALVEINGYAMARGSRNAAGALALITFLSSRRAATQLALLGSVLPAVVGATVPPWLDETAALVRDAPVVHGEGPRVFAPKWSELTFVQQAYRPFFEIESESDPAYLSTSAFLTKLQQLTDVYRAKGGESGNP